MTAVAEPLPWNAGSVETASTNAVRNTAPGGDCTPRVVTTAWLTSRPSTRPRKCRPPEGMKWSNSRSKASVLCAALHMSMTARRVAGSRSSVRRTSTVVVSIGTACPVKSTYVSTFSRGHPSVAIGAWSGGALGAPRRDFPRARRVLELAAPPDRHTVVHLGVESEVVPVADRPSASSRLVELLLEVVGHLRKRFGPVERPHRRPRVTTVDHDTDGHLIVNLNRDARAERRRSLNIMQRGSDGILRRASAVRDKVPLDNDSRDAAP